MKQSSITPLKHPSYMIDKISKNSDTVSNNNDSLIFWMNRYFSHEVFGGKDKTVLAKKKDVQKFLSFFFSHLSVDHIDSWTVSVTKAFLSHLQSTPSPITGNILKPTTINRILATLKHWSRWIERFRPFLSGSPFKDIQDLLQEDPSWNGLTNRQITLLKMACDQRLSICTKKTQNPLMEVAIFYLLLHTGIREFELCSLSIEQYKDNALLNLKRKGRMVTKKTFLPSEAREKLDAYLSSRTISSPKEPLFVSRFNNRLKELDVYRICKRLSNQASAQLSHDDAFILRPHQLRHTFLKRVADKHGLNYAKKVSGNVGIREIYRYTAPSDREIAAVVEDLFS